MSHTPGASGSGSGPATPAHASIRSSLPTPSGIARRSSLAKGGSPLDSPETAYKKQSLAEAISRHDPAKYRTAGGAGGEDADGKTNSSPLLTAGKLPRPGLAGRKSAVGLRPRSETPTGLPVPQSSQLSPPSLLHSRAASAASSADGVGSAGSPSRSRSPLVPTGRASLGGGATASSLAASSGVSRSYATPKRLSDVHTRASGTTTPSLPSHAAATIASRAREQPSNKTARRGKELELGDIVMMEGQGLTGVLRYLGPVQDMGGTYAGLELMGDSAGKGKNNGSVRGVQYFACADGDGVFCHASKVVATNDSPPRDAVARPASAMSNRSSRHSDVHERPPSTTPGRRRASTVSRPPSATPSRASSRASVRPPSVTPGSRPASAMSATRPASRLATRKSLGTIPSSRGDDEDQGPQRRAKTSAEYAAAAEKRITEGSRAHKLLGMTAKDLQQQRAAAGSGARVSSRLGGSPAKAGASSPLKSSLVGTRGAFGETARTPRSSLAGAGPFGAANPSTPSLPKARQSLGGIPTPRAAKGRASMFAKPPGAASSAAMPPPKSPTKDPARRPASALSLRSSSRLSNVHSAGDDDDDDVGAGAMLSGRNSSLDRARDLLEEMDLTPRRPAATSVRPSKHGYSASFSGYASVVPDEAFQQNESVAEAVVPLSLYEEQEAELERLRQQTEALEKQNADLLKQQGARKARMSEIRSNEAVLEEERAKLRAEAREKEKEMEEERQLERQDDLRRRKEIEEREKELKEKLEESTRSMAKLQDEHLKVKGDHESRTRDLEASLEESEKLIEEMKKSLESQAAKEEGETVQLKVKDAEIDSLKSAVRRLEADVKRERKELGDQIDELKDAGRETITLYEQRIVEVEQENRELVHNMGLLEQRAQEAIAAAEARYEAAISRNGGASGAASSAAEIDNENLREQVAHLQDRVGSYEDQLAEAHLALEKEKEYMHKKKERSVEIETSLKNEIKRLKLEVERVVASEKDTKEQYKEAKAALEEAKAEHETERGELEVLRADVANIESLNGGSMRGAGSKEMAEAKKKWEAERVRYEAEIKSLSAQLDGGTASLDLPHTSPSRDERRISNASSIASNGVNRRSSRTSLSSAVASSEASSANQVSGLNYLVRQLTDENVDIKNRHKLLESEIKDKLRAAEQKARTLELTVESLEKQLSTANAVSTSQSGAAGAADAAGSQKDLAAKLAECEQRLQESEAELVQLRARVKEVERSRERDVGSLNKEVAELEALVEARIFREDELEGEIDRLKRKLEKERSSGNGSGGSSSSNADAARRPGTLSSGSVEAPEGASSDPDRTLGSNSDLPPMRRRTTSQMEPDSPTANRRGSRLLSGSGAAPSSSTLEAGPRPLGSTNVRADNDDEDQEDDYCGLCSKPGHSVVDCSELDKPPPPPPSTTTTAAPAATKSGQADDGTEPCDDCGELGHRFEECPYANEIF